jgi:pimeloyl-ACP methyl ester carboxylesterase
MKIVVYENLTLFCRTLTVDCGITDPKVKAPSLLIMGEKDYVFKFPGMEEYIRSGAVKQFVPDLDIKYLREGSHFVHEQLPEQVNELIITFLNKHSI